MKESNDEREEMAPITNYQHDEKGKRVDVHRPSVIRPDDYELAPPIEGLPWWKSGPYVDYGTVAGTCDHCGHAIRYAVRYLYTPTGQIVTFGQDCDSLIGTSKDRAAYEFTKLRERARKDEREAKAKLEMAERVASFTRAYPDIVEWMNDHNWENERFDFLNDMQRSLATYGYLTTAQAEATRKIINKRIEQAQARLAEPQPTELAPEGKVTVRGKIISTKVVNTLYGNQTKMLVKLDNGNKVYGTMPNSIESAIWKNDIEDFNPVGVTVEFSATFNRNEDHFSFYSRPTKGTVV